MIERQRAVKALKRLRKRMNEVVSENNVLKLQIPALRDKLGNALWREQGQLREIDRLKGTRWDKIGRLVRG